MYVIQFLLIVLTYTYASNDKKFLECILITFCYLFLPLIFVFSDEVNPILIAAYITYISLMFLKYDRYAVCKNLMLTYILIQYCQNDQKIILDMYILPNLIFKSLMSLVLNDIFFYTFHRLLHTRYLYPRIHKQHHRKLPVGWRAFYASDIEHIFSNLLPIYLSSYCFMNMRFIERTIFWMFATYNSVSVHEDKFSLHFVHHKNMKSNFGNFPYIMDYIFGTFNK